MLSGVAAASDEDRGNEGSDAGWGVRESEARGANCREPQGVPHGVQEVRCGVCSLIALKYGNRSCEAFYVCVIGY